MCGLGHGSVGADPLGQAELETHICCFQIGRKYYFALFKAVQAARGQSAAQPSSLALSGPEWKRVKGHNNTGKRICNLCFSVPLVSQIKIGMRVWQIAHENEQRVSPSCHAQSSVACNSRMRHI